MNDRGSEGGKPPDGAATGVRPWSCARAEFRIKTPARGSKQRREQMQQMKGIASEGLNSTPYVRIKWDNGDVGIALFDTGAQWSLICNDSLTEEERAHMQKSTLIGRGVSGEKIPVIGEIWRSVKIGGVTFPNQRFIVVGRMICSVILGIDFWSRVSDLSFDFNRSVMRINGSSEEIPLLHHPSTDDIGSVDATQSDPENAEEEAGKIVVDTESRIPPRSEVLVTCYTAGLQVGKEYMVQPVTFDDRLVSTPYGMIRGSKDGRMQLRVANLSEEEIVLPENEPIATVEPGTVWVANLRAGRAFENQGLRKSSTNVSELVCKKLEPNKKGQLTGLLRRYEDVFYKGGELPIVRVGVEHTIRLKEDCTPVACKPRRLSKELADEVRGHVNELLEQGVIRESNSQWASPIVCARKKDGSLRMAIDYRITNEKSNTATLHPIPLIDDLLDRLGKAKYFAVLDAKSGYHQLPLKKEDSEITAFVVPGGHYEFAGRTPFGLKGAGYSFQRMMSVVLGNSNFVDALCYLDDVLVWGETWEIFMKRLKKILEKVRISGLALAAGKCQFGVREVSYLGCTIKEGMVLINEQRVQQLRKIERPGNVRELRRALGAFGYVQRWLPGLAQIARPLYSAITDQPYARLKWTEEMDTAFVTIKNMIADAVSLSLPDMERPFTLVTDCSQLAAGAMLAQRSTEAPEILKPVAFYHHALSQPEKAYSATEKELLALVKAVLKFRVYLGKGFDLITDHHALQWLKSLNPENETGRRGRWLDLIQQFDMRVVHKKGKSPEMRIADYLSRVKCDGDVTGTSESEVFVVLSMGDGDDMAIGREDILREQENDDAVKAVRKAIVERRDLNPGGSASASWRKPSLGDENGDIAAMWKHRDRLFVDNDGVVRLRFNGGRRTENRPSGVVERNRIIVPRSLRPKVMNLVHRSATAAHMGNTRTWRRARNSFWWPKMRQEIENYIQACEECGLNKHVNNPNKAPVVKTSIPGKPLDEMMLDFIGPFQAASSHPFRYVLQMQDVFSRFIVFVACVDSTALTAADAVMGRWLCLFGMPKTMRSDRGPHFIAEVFEELCRRAGIRHKLGSPEHPQSQGQVERQNQLFNQVRCLCDNDGEAWPSALYKVQCSHNTAMNATTGFTPARLLFGKEFNLPEDFITSEGGTDATPGETVLEERDEESNLLIEQARANLEENQEARVEEATADRNDAVPYRVGDLVRYRLSDDARSKKGGKMSPRYSEPYRVLEVKGDGYTYTLEPADGNSRGMRKDRRINYLKTVERNEREDSIIDSTTDTNDQSVIDVPEVTVGVPNTDAVDPDGGDNSTPGTRRSSRKTEQVKRLQVDGRRKRYEESDAIDSDSTTDEAA
jgi:transposase InsO family protein